MTQHADIQVSLEGPRDELIAKCRELETADNAAESRKGLYLALIVIAAIFGVAMVFVVPIAGGILIAGAVVLLIMRSAAGSADIEDRKLQVPTYLMLTLGPELSAKKPMKMDIDFRSFERVGLIHSDGGGWGSPSSSTYRHVWLTMHLALANGARVLVEVATNSKKKTKPKRKYTKIKQRTSEKIRVMVTPPRGVDLTAAAKITHTKPRGLKLARSRMKPRGAEFVFETNELLFTQGRYGGNVAGAGGLVTGNTVLSAVIASYKMFEKSIEGNV